MRQFSVTVPIAGHAIVIVEAEDEREAKNAAFDKVDIDSIESWEPLEQFNQGNVCYCPQPWAIEVYDDGEIDA